MIYNGAMPHVLAPSAFGALFRGDPQVISSISMIFAILPALRTTQ